MIKNQIIQGDIREIAKTLPDQSVNCIVTSPAYYGLRDYGTAEWEGGNGDCDHVDLSYHTDNNKGLIGLRGPNDKPGHQYNDDSRGGQQYRTTCARCGAVRIDKQMGLEATPEEYVAELVGVFRELKRVLRDDGTVWLNLGDSYASQGGPEPLQTISPIDGASNTQNAGKSRNAGTLKPKNLIGIPWRVAFALQADGWYLRSEIIWAKKNCMPESCKDRPTKSHEQIFLLTKRATYWYDAEAIREPHKTESLARYEYGLQSNAPKDGLISAGSDTGCFKTERMGDHMNPAGRNARTVWSHLDEIEQHNRLLAFILARLATDNPDQLHNILAEYGADQKASTDVWELATTPYAGAHFAVMPPALAQKCILAGCPSRVCVECDTPHERVIISTGQKNQREIAHVPNNTPTKIDSTGWKPTSYGTGQLKPICQCSAPHRPGIVLDPFFGAGTVGVVAKRHKRDWLGIELNSSYVEMAQERLDQTQPALFAT